MSILSNDSLAGLPKNVQPLSYDRSNASIGVVHLGPGAFHRGHQAVFFDDLLSKNPEFGICAVSLRSSTLRNKLQSQDYLYTLGLLGNPNHYRVIGSILKVLVAPEDPAAVLDVMSKSSTHIVTMTITEKGYCLNGDGELDVTREDVRHDLDNPRSPKTAIGFCAEALRIRRNCGIAPPVIISCDNLADNGVLLRSAIIHFCENTEPALAEWVAGYCSFPNTMVDSITPATTDTFKMQAESETGFKDAWPIQRERFSQWVVEDATAKDLSCLEQVGVTLTRNVEGYERAKLRILNGTHSTIAYLGLLLGYSTVHEALKDPKLDAFIKHMIHNEIIPSLEAPDGLDLKKYATSVLCRFKDASVPYQLSQIAWDGSMKMPFRVLSTIRDNLADNKPICGLATSIAAWFTYIAQVKYRDEDHKDPLKPLLFETVGEFTKDIRSNVNKILSLRQIFDVSLADNIQFQLALLEAFHLLERTNSADSVYWALSVAVATENHSS